MPSSTHSPILQGAPVEPGAHQRQRQRGALSPDFLQGAATRMAEHPAGQMFGLGSVTNNRHHRAVSRGASVVMRGPAGNLFLSRAVAAQWEMPGRVYVDVPHFAYLMATKDQCAARPGDPGGHVDGSWLCDGDPYSQQGRAYPAMSEDSDPGARRPRPGDGADWALGLAAVVLAGLLAVSCFMTDGGGF